MDVSQSYTVMLILLLSWVENSQPLECYHCSGIRRPSACNDTLDCHSEEVCYVERNTTGDTRMSYTFGCRSKLLCGGFSSPTGGSLVGRDAMEQVKRQAVEEESCLKCCNTDGCNINLCIEHEATECEDDPDHDCALLSSSIDICADQDRAQKICPKFCGYCPRDGGWSIWAVWSSCNVTCDDGIQTRVRQCSNPTPVHGGRDCEGPGEEKRICTNDPCPVHGGWSLWSEWGTCSTTCDVGIQRRDRHCSNPYPDKQGDHCFGDARDDRICLPRPCADGGWSEWGEWENCSVACGGGIMIRERQCDNPPPSPYGLQCVGNHEQTEVCNTEPCDIVDGMWSEWGAWSDCPVACGGAIYRRYRMCNNPAPSEYGRACVGNDEQSDLCNPAPCRMTGLVEGTIVNADVMAFAANQASGYYNTTDDEYQMSYAAILYNGGSHFTESTGEFVAPTNGLYLFYLQSCFREFVTDVALGESITAIKRNGMTICAHGLPQRLVPSCLPLTCVATLNTGDIVTAIKRDRDGTVFDLDYFSGALLKTV